MSGSYVRAAPRLDSMEFGVTMIASLLVTAGLATIGYWNYVLFQDYISVFFWAFVVSQALQGPKNALRDALDDLGGRYAAYGGSGGSSKADGDLPLSGTLTAILAAPFKSTAYSRGTLQRVLRVGSAHSVQLLTLVCAFILVKHALSWHVAAAVFVVAVLVLLGLELLLYRRLTSIIEFVNQEATLALIVTAVSFTSAAFLLLFLGSETLVEGFGAADSMAAYAQGFIGSAEIREGLASRVEVGATALHHQYQALAGAHGDASWWPMAKSAVLGHVLPRLLEAADDILAETKVADAAASDAPRRRGGSRGRAGGLDALHDLAAGFRRACDKGEVESVFCPYAQAPLDANGDGLVDMKDASEIFHSFRAHVDEDLQAILTTGGATIAGISASMAQGVALTVASAVQSSFKALAFLTFLLMLLRHRDPVRAFIADVLPMSSGVSGAIARDVSSALQETFHDVLNLPGRMASFHALVTILIFTALRVPYRFFATFLAFMLTLLPLAPAWAVCLPWVVGNGLTGRPLKAAALLVCHKVLFAMVDSGIYNEMAASPALTAMSVWLGFTVFGIQGVVFGPLLVSGVVLVKRGMTLAARWHRLDFVGSPGEHGDDGSAAAAWPDARGPPALEPPVLEPRRLFEDRVAVLVCKTGVSGTPAASLLDHAEFLRVRVPTHLEELELLNFFASRLRVRSPERALELMIICSEKGGAALRRIVSAEDLMEHDRLAVITTDGARADLPPPGKIERRRSGLLRSQWSRKKASL